MSGVSLADQAERRRLSFSEDGFARFPKITVFAEFQLQGSLDTALLWEAFSLLRQEFPVVTGRIEPLDDGFEFVVDGRDVAAEEVFQVRPASGGESDWTAPDVDIATTLTRIEAVVGESWHRVVFAMSHALADGAHIVSMYSRLWELYTSLVESGRADVAEPGPLPRSPQAVLEARGVRKGPSTGSERVANVVWSGAMPSAEDLPDGRMRTVYGKLSFDPETTDALQAKAKSAGLSLYSLVSGAILLAERGAFPETAQEELTLGLMSLVNGRARLRPPVGSWEVTNLVGASYSAVGVSPKSDPVRLGQKVQEQVREDVDSGLCLQPMLAQVDIREPREPSIVCSNLGAFPDLALPEGLALQDLTCSLHYEMASTDMALSDRKENIRVPSVTASVYQMWRIGGRLQINMINLSGSLPDEARQRILHRVEQVCRQLVDRGGA